MSPKRTRRSSQSRLIEFPRRPRPNPDARTEEAALPSWRRELNEKVKAIKAKRVNGEEPIAETEAADEQPLESESEAAPPFRQNGLETSEPRQPSRIVQQSQPSRGNRRSGRELRDEAESKPVNRDNDVIVEAALTRVRRAAENASRHPHAPFEKATRINSLSIDRQATARALEPEIEVRPKLPEPSLESVSLGRTVTAPSNKLTSSKASASASTSPALDPGYPSGGYSTEIGPVTSHDAIDEIEPDDYLTAEIRKVDKALSAEFLRNESPPLISHLVIGLIDMVMIAVSLAPFWAMAKIAEVNIAGSTLPFGAMIIVIAFFYLAVTQCLAGKTVGMMLTNTRVVTADNFESPATLRLLVRSAGYLVSLAPGGLGFLWMFLNRKRRGWHDYVSCTQVVRDF